MQSIDDKDKFFAEQKASFLRGMALNKEQFEKDKTAVKAAIKELKKMSKPSSYQYALQLLKTKGMITDSSYELYQQVPISSLIAHCDFFLPQKKHGFFKRKTNADHLLNELQSKGKLRCNREIMGLPRTFTLALNNNGSIDMYLEPKGKIADQDVVDTGPSIKKLSLKEREERKKSGSSKTGKPCWKLSEIPPEKYFSLVYNHRLTKLDVHPFKTEMQYATQFGEHVDCLEGGTVYVSKNGLIKAVAYSKAAVSSLEDKLIATGLSTVNDDPASEHEKYQLIQDVLLGIKAMHDKGYAHQDLKPDNILVYKIRDQFGTVGLRAKISDFGLTTTIAKPTRSPGGTFGYASPEIFGFYLYNSSVKQQQYQYFTAPAFAYGKQVANTTIQSTLKILNPATSEEQRIKNLLTTPHKQPAQYNDMWAMGIVAYQILYGKLPRYSPPNYSPKDPKFQKELAAFEQNIKLPFLQALLDPNSATRCSVQGALDMVDKLLNAPLALKATEAKPLQAKSKSPLPPPESLSPLPPPNRPSPDSLSPLPPPNRLFLAQSKAIPTPKKPAPPVPTKSAPKKKTPPRLT